MSEQDLVRLWGAARMQIILSQIAPVLLLTATVALLQTGIAETGIATRLALTGILLAAGVLGAVAQFAAASEGAAIARDLHELGPQTAPGRLIARLGPWTLVVRFVTPAVFVVVFVLVLVALFAPGAA